jgi:probable rRNA maturation factor
MMLEIALDAEEEWDSSSSWEPRIRKAAEAAIAESAFPQLAEASRHVELSVRLASDEEVRGLNAHWRGKDKPTNVLSFPMAEQYELEQSDEDGPTIMLGDLILAHGVCEREAAEKGISVEEHATHLVVHGTLHLLGYDHQADADAVDMETREIRALSRLGIADPYEARC